MTIMEFDYKAFVKPGYKRYEIDRAEYPTVDDLFDLACDCTAAEVFLIRCYEDGRELFTIRNAE